VTQRTRRRRLGEILVADGALTQEQLEDAIAAQASSETRRRLGRTIVQLGLCREEDIAAALASQLRLDTVDLTAVGPAPEALALVPRKLAERHGLLPLRLEDDVLVVAMIDPTNVVALDDVKLTAGVRGLRAVVTTESDLEAAVVRAYASDQSARGVADAFGDDDVVAADEDLDQPDAAEPDEQPVIRLANAILADAVRTRASDVHVEPERDSMRVRYRIDGLLRETMRVPKHIGPALTSRLKIMSNLDIAERRRPQDGRAMIRVEGQEVDLRVSTMPTMFGETIVLRLLRKGTAQLELTDLGLTPEQLATFRSMLYRPQGLVVTTGPTGSGKTTTLYAGLTELADPIRNVLTLEDPIEYELGGVNQTQVNPRIDLTFARGLRNVLRQDPDVVMVGEIRDRETAELAMEASFTGHLVLSTLHTNDAVSTVVRLLDLGVERFLIASSLLLVVAQRLARVVCDTCRRPADPDPKVLTQLGIGPDELEGAELATGAGCQVCSETGYVGRVGLYELLAVTPAMRELITAGGSETQLARMARQQGMRSIREDGISKALAGITTLEEVLRTTPEPTVGDPA
jgi:type IV pilus assembly protein PilB